LQCTHCVYVLIDAPPGATASVEVLEDVALEDATEDVEATQLKSSQKTNAISNRSIELWKTFKNWIDEVENATLKIEKTVFHLRLGRKRRGPICEAFSEVVDLKDATAAIERARAEFFTPRGNLKGNVPAELGSIVESVFDSRHSELLRNIVARFRLSFGTKHAYEELLDRLKTKLIDDDVVEDVLLRALGWVKKELDNAVERGEPPMIAVDEFRTEISAFRDRLKGRNYLPSLAGPPSLEQIELHKLRVFVRQLNLISASTDQILSGITDFLSATTNRVEYARRGYVHSDSFLEFEDALQSLWQNHRDEIELEQSEDEITRGRRLASHCLRASVRLQGIDVPAAFVRGCFHSLADRPSIGWHPRYESLLAQPEVNRDNP
jgi:hypothetical protein